MRIIYRLGLSGRALKGFLMYTSMRGIITSVSIALLAAVCLPTVRGVIIDFEGIPDGTPVSAGNPYAGLAVIQATAASRTLIPPDLVDSTLDVREGTILHGAVFVLPPDPGSLGFDFGTEIVVNFLQPAVNLGFDAMVEMPGLYSFQGRDEQGATFTGGGILSSGGPLSWFHIDVSIPPGSFLTQLRLSNHDNVHGVGALIQMDNIRFDVHGVPDSGSGVILLGLSGAGIYLLQRRSRSCVRRPIRSVSPRA
jgi:hypothetical protein